MTDPYSSDPAPTPTATTREPSPADPLQAQTVAERRAVREDFVAHLIAVMIVLGFFALAFISLLGLVNLSSPVVSSLVGSILGYAVAKLDPVLVRYYHAPQRPTGQPTQPGQR